MAGRTRESSSGQRLASLLVLALLCAIAVFLLARQPRLNPAVEVSLRAPAPKAGAGIAGGAATGTGAGVSGEASGEAATPGAEPSATSAAALAGRASLASLLPEAVPGPGLNVKALAAAEAFTPATLSDKIDGKAEMYLAAGFAAMACRSYQVQTNPPARVEVYLYRMKSVDAAFAVFSGQRRSGSAQSPLAKNGYLTENALFLTSGPNYLEVIGDRAGLRPALEALAKAVLTALEPAATPGGKPDAASGSTSGAKPAAELQPLDLLPTAGLKADTLRLAVADAFGCQGLTNIYTAEYDAIGGRKGAGAAALLSRRKNPAEAVAQLKLYQRFLTDNGFVLQAAPGAPAGAVVLALEGIGVEILFTRGPWLAGVHEASTLDAALRLAAELDATLQARGLLP